MDELHGSQGSQGSADGRDPFGYGFGPGPGRGPGSGDDRSGSDRDDPLEEEEDALLRAASTVEYADDHRGAMLERIADKPTAITSSPAARSLRSGEKRAQGAGAGSTTPPAVAGDASVSPLLHAPVQSHTTRRVAAASPGSLLRSAAAIATGQSPQQPPHTRSGASSPMPAAAAAAGAQRPKSTMHWLAATRAARAAAEAAQIPTQRSPALGFGYGLTVQASAAAIAAVASPAPSAAAAAPTVDLTAAPTAAHDMDMASPHLPAGIGVEAAPTTAPPAGGISAFPPPFDSPVIDDTAADAAPSSRPAISILAAAPSSLLYDSTQPRSSQAADSRVSIQGRPRMSARDVIASQGLGLPPAQPSAAAAAPAAPRSHSHHHSSSEHGKHRHHHHHHHRSRSEKDTDGAAAAGAAEHRHRHRHHKRTHSASSGDDQVAGGEGEKERKHKKHKKHKKDKKDRDRSVPDGSSALVPVSHVLVKQEVSGAAAAASSTTSRIVAGSSVAFPLFPDDDEDAMWGNAAPALQRAAHSAKLIAAAKAPKKNVKRVELSFKDLQRQKQIRPVLSKALSQETTEDERAKQEEEVAQGEIQEFEREASIPASGAAGVVTGRARLALTTPPRRPRLSTQLGGMYGEEEDEEIGDYDARGDARGRGSGGFSSGEKRGGRGKKSELERRLLDALNTEASKRRMQNYARLSHHASMVASVGGTPQTTLLEAGCLYVRVLTAERHFNMRTCLVSLCGPDVDAEHTLAAPASLLSPVPVLPKEVAEVCRAVARTYHTEFASVPAGLLRVLILPPSDHVDDGGGGGSIQRLDNFPECFLRIRQLFTCQKALMGISTLLDVRDFSRLLGDEVPRVKAMEQREWEAETRRTTHEEELIRSEEAQLRALEANAAHKPDAAEHAQQPQQASEDGSQDGGALMIDVLAPLAVPRKPAPDAFDAVPRLLDVSEREWPVELLHYHPSLQADQLYDLLQSKHAARQPLVTLQEWHEPSDMLFGGVIQKTTWRGVNIVPSDEQRAQMEAYEAAARTELPLPSFYVQDASGGVVEVEVPLHMLPRWCAVLYHGLGGWVQLLGLRMSTRVSASRMHGEPPSSMLRSFQSQLCPGACVEKRPWLVLTVTEESSFRLSMPSLGAPLSPHVRTSTIDVTPLLLLAQVRSVGAARRLNRVTVVGRMMHLENHARHQWKLYLTDESLRVDPENPSPVPTSSMLVYVWQPFHHEILDSVACFGADCCFKLVDVAVSFDKQLNVPVLTADKFTDIVKIVSSGNDQQDRIEEKQILARDRSCRAIRKLNLYTKQWLMIPQHIHHALQTHSVHDVTIDRLLQGGRVLTPLMQRHSIFALLANIVTCPMTPLVYPCCNWCQTLLGTSDMPGGGYRVPTVCHHCHRHCEIKSQDPRFWLHHVTVLVHVPAFDDGAPAPSASRLFPLQLEASELQDLTRSTNEDVKGRAFRFAAEFHKSAPHTSLAESAEILSFQVTTRISRPSDDLLSESSQGFASQSYASQAEWSSQPDEAVECIIG